MADKLNELENRLNRLEDKVKIALLQVEKRFENIKLEEPPIEVMEQKIQEMEDLLLLLQLDVTKLKDVTEGGLGTSGSQSVLDVYTRLRKIEDDITGMKHTRAENVQIDNEEEKPSVGRQLDEIEGRLEKIEKERELSRSGVLADVRKILHSKEV